MLSSPSAQAQRQEEISNHEREEEMERLRELFNGRTYLTPSNNPRERFSLVQQDGVPQNLLMEYLQHEQFPAKVINTNLCLVYREVKQFFLVRLLFVPDRDVFVAQSQPDMFITSTVDWSQVSATSMRDMKVDDRLVFIFSESHLGQCMLMPGPNLKRDNLARMRYCKLILTARQPILEYDVGYAYHLYKCPSTHKLQVARVCMQCEKVAARHQVWMRCSGCRNAYYCSTECQQDSWDMWHKFVCKLTVTHEDDQYYHFNSKFSLQ